ncbi:MAG: phage tailspike protein [Hafnia sp.]
MSDITANLVVSMPSQLFTMPRSFKAVANGKIYIGQIDTDPVNPENQIPVYLENEDGSHVQVAQPIVINAGGYPVYNGQISKFVTENNHSMAVYDSYNTQQFYYPNILKYDPDQFRQEFDQPDAFKIIGQCESISQLRQVNNASDGQRILVKAYIQGTNVGGGEFSWNSTTTQSDDNGYIIRPTGVITGAWIRVSKTNKVSLTEYGVVGDNTDVSAKVLAAFSMANQLRKGVNLDVDYRGQAIVIDGYENVIVRGIGKGKLVDGCNKVFFTFKNCDGLDIYGIDLDGNRMNQTSTTQPGTPDGIGLIRVEQCNNWKIQHCEIHDNRLGAAVLIVDNGTNTSTNWEASIQNGFLHKNYIHDNGVSGVVASDGVFSWSHSTVISDNVIRRCTDYGIATDYSQRYIIKNNIISETLVSIGVLGARDVLVDGNNIDTCELGIAVALSGNPATNPYISRNVTICNNKIRDVVEVTALGDGIYVDSSCEYVNVNNNTVVNAKRGVAVSCALSSVSGNTSIDCRVNSFYIESKQGVCDGNLPLKSDGGDPAPSYIAGSSNKSLNGGVGYQEAYIRKDIGLTAVKICEVNSLGLYSAAIVDVEYAGLVNSFGPAVATRTFSVKKTDTTFSVNELSHSGDSSQVILDMNTSSGIPSVYVNWVSGASTTATIIVRLRSSGLQDDAMFIRTV